MRTEKIGLVVSDKMQKTRIVRVERLVRHSKYEKVMRVREKFYAHDETNQSKAGDSVRIQAARPLSHMKRWTLVEVLKAK
jgi:small subunit ribosomal protein S17